MSAINIYASAENPIHLGSDKVDWVVFNKSYNPMITTRDVSLKAEIKTLTEGGITIFNAWGRIISLMVCI